MLTLIYIVLAIALIAIFRILGQDTGWFRLLEKAKDGGPSSPVDAYFLFEFKGLCSIALLKFNKGSREAYHTHAFNAYTWFLSGCLAEVKYVSFSFGSRASLYSKGIIPKFTSRNNNHRVLAIKDSWCLTLRGPWSDTWTETNVALNTTTTFTHGRKVVSIERGVL